MAKKSRNNKTINLARELLKKAAPLVATRKNPFKADSLNHTDVAFDNFEERERFLLNYARLSGPRLELILEKVKIREPLVSLHWILWGATKLCDLNENRTAPELIQAHAANTSRYERIADPANIEKLLDLFHPG